MRLSERKYHQPWRVASAIGRACGIVVLNLLPPAANAQEQLPSVEGTAALPRDLSPWGMFMNADVVVKVVMFGLVIASIVTWTVWLAKTIELLKARRQVRAALGALNSIQSLLNVKTI
jgi:biopolymer transport protein ExbB